MKDKLTLLWDGEVATIQRAPYIEDGWYILGMPNGTFHVYEIPQYGGEEDFIGEFQTFKEAILKAKELV